MNWVVTLAEYYRLSRTGETQHWLCRRWLLQGGAFGLFAGVAGADRATAAMNRAPAFGRRRLAALTEGDRRPTQQQQRQADQQQHHDHFTELVAHAFCCHVAPLLAEIPPAGEGDEDKRH